MIADHVFEKELQDEVNHPTHYKQGKYEEILDNCEVIEK